MYTRLLKKLNIADNVIMIILARIYEHFRRSSRDHVKRRQQVRMSSAYMQVLSRPISQLKFWLNPIIVQEHKSHSPGRVPGGCFAEILVPSPLSIVSGQLIPVPAHGISICKHKIGNSQPPFYPQDLNNLYALMQTNVSGTLRQIKHVICAINLNLRIFYYHAGVSIVILTN